MPWRASSWESRSTTSGRPRGGHRRRLDCRPPLPTSLAPFEPSLETVGRGEDPGFPDLPLLQQAPVGKSQEVGPRRLINDALTDLVRPERVTLPGVPERVGD